MPEENKDLTDAQVENWRKVLSMSLGPAALLLSREDITKIRDNMQAYASDVGNIHIKATRAHTLIDQVEITEEEISELHEIISCFENMIMKNNE